MFFLEYLFRIFIFVSLQCIVFLPPTDVSSFENVVKLVFGCCGRSLRGGPTLAWRCWSLTWTRTRSHPSSHTPSTGQNQLDQQLFFKSNLKRIYIQDLCSRPMKGPQRLTERKEKKIFSYICKEIQSWAVAKSYMRKGFLIYEEMRKYFPIY